MNKKLEGFLIVSASGILLVLGLVLLGSVTWLGVVIIGSSGTVCYKGFSILFNADDSSFDNPTPPKLKSHTEHKSLSPNSKTYEFSTLYNQSLLEINKTFSSSLTDKQARVELSCFLTFAYDYYGFIHNLNRQKINDDVLRSLQTIMKNDYPDYLSVVDSRMSLYGSFATHKRMPMACINPVANLNELNPFLLAFYGFCDVLLDPSIADDYDGAPVFLLDINRCISMSPSVNNLLTTISASIHKSLSNF